MNEQTTKGGVFTFTHPSGTTCVILTDDPRFDPGELVSSAAADDALDFADACLAVGRMWERNERALLRGDLLVSTHRDRRGNDFAILTLPNRSQTWVILVEECKRLCEPGDNRQLC